MTLGSVQLPRVILTGRALAEVSWIPSTAQPKQILVGMQKGYFDPFTSIDRISLRVDAVRMLTFSISPCTV
jgi:hypothetical protein